MQRASTKSQQPSVEGTSCLNEPSGNDNGVYQLELRQNGVVRVMMTLWQLDLQEAQAVSISYLARVSFELSAALNLVQRQSGDRSLATKYARRTIGTPKLTFHIEFSCKD